MHHDRTRLTAVAWTYLVLAVVACGVYPFAGDTGRATLLGLSMLSIVPAGFIAHRNHRMPKILTTGLVIVGVLYVAEAIASSTPHGVGGVAINDVFDLIATAGIIVLVAFIVSERRGGLNLGDLLDGVVIGLGAWLVSWIFLVEPAIRESELQYAAVLVNALYIPTAIPILALSALLVFGSGRRRPSVVFLAFGLMLNTSGDVIYALESVRSLGSWAYTAADLCYIMSVAACAASFTHPSASSLLTTATNPEPVALPGRLAATSASLIIPVAIVSIVSPESTADRIGRVVTVSAIIIVVAVRLFTASAAQMRSQNELARAAQTDELTGLVNTKSLLARADEHIDHIWASSARPSIYLFGLDGFQTVNDSAGHAVGDEVLVSVAERFRAVAEGLGAIAARSGGDEFIVFDPHPRSEEEARDRASIIQAQLAEPVPTSRGEIFVSAACGIASMRTGTPTPAAELLRLADIANYRAKASGRGTMVSHEPAMNARVEDRLTIEHALRRALVDRELAMFYQPIIDVSVGTVDGVEALMRWRRSDGSIVPPDEFISIAEETGLINDFGAWALLESLSQLRAWVDDGIVGPRTSMSVNVSPRQLSHPGFVDVVCEALQRSGVDASSLWLEVTESLMVENAELAQEAFDRLRAIGVRLALDDFGTGYSSLSMLRQFAVDRIKIDRTFVSALVDDDQAAALVRTIITLGDSMQVDIVAEGVETFDQLRALRNMHCAKAQGYLISRPVPASSLASTIRALDSLSTWPEFSQLMGDSSLAPLPPPRV